MIDYTGVAAIVTSIGALLTWYSRRKQIPAESESISVASMERAINAYVKLLADQERLLLDQKAEIERLSARVAALEAQAAAVPKF